MTQSEKLLTQINNNLFFKEFTYAQTEIYGDGGDTKELADNVVWLDELLLVYQVKGREIAGVGDIASEEKWFEKTVAVKAKKQIRDTLNFFNTWKKLPVINERGQTIDIAQAAGQQFIKLVIYEPNSELLEAKRNIKFLESSTAGLIHLFQLKDYELVCKYLVTPVELAEYLQFREDMFLLHGAAVNRRPEEYLIAHFFSSPDNSVIDDRLLDNLSKIDTDTGSFEVGWILSNFFEKMVLYENGKETDYHFILKEIARLNRFELQAFSERYKSTLNNAHTNTFTLPLRFAIPRTGCGFVFVTLQKDKSQYWENALLNFVDTYRYKHKLPKCVGVVMSKDGPWFQINWAYSTGDWEYDAGLEQALKNETEFYGSSQVQLLERYKLKK
jgi:hypothetical protein